MKTNFKPLAWIAVLGAVSFGFSISVRAQTTVAFLMLPEFANCLTNSQSNPTATNQNSLALFSGTLGAYSPPGSGLPPIIPTNTAGLQLAGCGFGQMLARSVPFPDFETETIRIAQEKLYPPTSADTRELIAGSGAAFRYKQLLYTNDGTDVCAAFKGIAAWFGEPERQRARDGIKILRDALKYSPLDKKLRNALLDAYYDFIVAEAQHVKSDLAEVAKYRLGLVSIPAGDFIIDHEIAGYTNILYKYGGILDEYGKLFLDRGGVDVSQVDSTAPPGIVLGQWIFQQEQPQRNQMAAQFRDASGNLTTVPLGNATNSMLFAGYKDYGALLGVMRDYAQTAAELAKLYGMRGRAAVQAGQKDDKTLGFELIEGINRELLLNTSLLNALLPNAVPPNSRVAGRYYADPIHYLRAQNNMILADFAFRSAQRWVFLLLRALEYKYNQPFVYTEPIPGSPRWELVSLFRLRNMEEFGQLLNAMDQFNLANLGKLNGRSTVTEKISLKNDVWGRTLTGSSARLTEFRTRIQACLDAQRGVYVLPLNTWRLSVELENGSLFNGAEYGLNHTLTTPGYYLDKIEWIKVKFVDSSQPSPVTKTADLSYGGTCFVRPECASPADPGLESRNELRSFPFRYFSMGTDPTTGVLKADASAEQRATINFVFWNQPDKAVEPGDDYAATFWKERSVAISDLDLTIAASKVNLNTIEDVHIYIRHRYALRTVCQP